MEATGMVMDSRTEATGTGMGTAMGSLISTACTPPTDMEMATGYDSEASGSLRL